MTTWVAFGFIMIIGSHWVSDSEERAWLRDAGSAVVGFSVVRWLAQQGKRRKNENGQQIRTPTIRIPPDKVAEIQRIVNGEKHEG